MIFKKRCSLIKCVLDKKKITNFSQLITVVPNGLFQDETKEIPLYDVVMWQKEDSWQSIVSSEKGRAGKNGLSFSKCTNDGKTPIGLFPIPFAFGMDEAHYQLPYRQITSHSYWAGDDWGDLSNSWYEGEEPLGKDYEHLEDFPVQYKRAMVIGYNNHPFKKGRGNAIFFHAYGKKNTAGCVAVSLDTMEEILQHAQEGLYIIIAPTIEYLKEKQWN